jgi:hypothetical protein
MNHKGTGLGLSICKNLVEQMGGKVTVESELNVGSKFIITMQLRVTDKVIFSINTPFMNERDKLRLFEEYGAYNFTPDFKNKFFLKREIDDDASSYSSVS